MTKSDSHREPEISVVINTLNEEHNLPYCLRSVVPWAADIVVVDMHSSDATRDIAERYGARVFLHEPLGFADPARAFAISKAKCEWILILDADELVPRGLYEQLRKLAAEDQIDVVQIPRQNLMFGAPIKYTGWNATEDRQARFFRKGSLTTTGEVHRFLHPDPGARIGAIPEVDGRILIHFNYVSMSQFIEKLNRYTTIEATQAFERHQSMSPRAVLSSAFSEWYYRYVNKKGYRDGWRGFFLALSMAFYRVAAAAKLTELRDAGTKEQIGESYQRIAESLIAAYGDEGAPR